MNNLREVIKSKSFTINPNIIKSIRVLDMSLDEFLLLLYFINIKEFLDIEDIEIKIGFNKNEVMEVFNSLISKGFVELKVIKGKNGIDEVISLDVFYDKLLLKNEENEKDSKSDDIYSIFETELGRTLSSFEYEMINKWLDNKVSEDTIKNSLKEAIINGVTNFRYIDKIVYDWSKKGYKSSEDKELDKTEVYDYDWLNEE